MRNHATAVPTQTFSSNPSLAPPLSPLCRPSLVSRRISSFSHSLVTTALPSSVATSHNAVLQPLIKPRSLVNMAAYNVRTLMQSGQQVALARTLDSLKIDVCCISETRIQDSSVRVELTAPSLSSRYWLRTSGDATSAALGQAGVGVVLSSAAEACLTDWIPVNSRLCAVRLASSFAVRTNRPVKRSLFVISAYAPTDCSPDSVKDSFYSDLANLINLRRSSDIVLLAGDMNAQVGKLNDDETCLGGRYGVGRRSDNGERLLQLCADKGLYLVSTAFRHKTRQSYTWRPPSPDQPWSQLDHIAISYRWRGSIQDCRSLWNTCLDSDHALVRCRLSIQFPGRTLNPSKRLCVDKLKVPVLKNSYQRTLASKIKLSGYSDPNKCWADLSGAIQASGKAVCGEVTRVNKTHWMSQKSLDLLENRRNIPSGHQHNRLRREIRKKLKRSIRDDKKAWLADQAKEMEVAFASGNSSRLFQLIRATGGKRTSVSETITEEDGALIHSKTRRLKRWAEYFENQLSWPPATCNLQPAMLEPKQWAVSLDSPTFAEVKACVNALKRRKAPGPDEIPPALFKEGGDVLIKAIVHLFELVWASENVPTNWGHSIIVPIFKKGSRNDCGNHRGISLTPVITRLLASVILRRLTNARESNIREEQAGFRPGRGCIDHIFTLRQVLEQRSIYKRETIAVFLDFKGAFDSVDRVALLESLGRRGMPQKYVNILTALYSHSSAQVRVYNELSAPFNTKSGVRQGCPLSPFLFNFVIDEIMEASIQGSETLGVEMLPGRRLTDLDYADDIVLLFDSFEQAQFALDSIAQAAQPFGMRFAPTKCKAMVQNCGVPTTLQLYGEPLEFVDRFTYLGSCISNDGSVTQEVSFRIAKARAVYASLNHIWRMKDISRQLKGRIYRCTVRAVLLYGCETWTLKVEDLRHLQTFENRCLRSIGGIGWYEKVTNDKVRALIFGDGKDNDTLSRAINLHRLRWLGHVLRMPSQRLPLRALQSETPARWRKGQGGQKMTWQKEMKSLTKNLANVGRVRLPGWGHRDPSYLWLETLKDMASNRTQWRECCRCLAGSSEK